MGSREAVEAAILFTESMASQRTSAEREAHWRAENDGEYPGFDAVGDTPEDVWDRVVMEARAAKAALDAFRAAPSAAEAGAVPWAAVESALREWHGRARITAKMEEAGEDGIGYAWAQEQDALNRALDVIHAYASPSTGGRSGRWPTPRWP